VLGANMYCGSLPRGVRSADHSARRFRLAEAVQTAAAASGWRSSTGLPHPVSNKAFGRGLFP